MDNEEEIRHFLKEARRNLQLVKNAVDDVKGGPPDRKVAGVINVATYGRATTRTLHRLKSRVEGWDDWYRDYREEMEGDELMEYFWNLRTDALKRGESGVGWKLHVHKINTAELDAPENATSFFVGDEIGGIGWKIEQPDGSTVKHYYNPPSDAVSSTPLLPDPPEQHLGEDVSGASVDELCSLYYQYIKRIVDDANERFSPN